MLYVYVGLEKAISLDNLSLNLSPYLNLGYLWSSSFMEGREALFFTMAWLNIGNMRFYQNVKKEEKLYKNLNIIALKTGILNWSKLWNREKLLLSV